MVRRCVDCHAGTNQRWYIDTQSRIHSSWLPDKCVDVSAGKGVVATCSAAATQRFDQLGEWHLAPTQRPYRNNLAISTDGITQDSGNITAVWQVAPMCLDLCGGGMLVLHGPLQCMPIEVHSGGYSHSSVLIMRNHQQACLRCVTFTPSNCRLLYVSWRCIQPHLIALQWSVPGGAQRQLRGRAAAAHHHLQCWP